MALFARTLRTLVELPWGILELLDWEMRWGALSVMPNEPTSEIWAEDLFSSTNCWLSVKYDDATDSSGSEICDAEDDEEDGWSSSESEEELEGFSLGSDGNVDFWGDRWFWSPDELAVDSSLDLIDACDIEMSSIVVKRLVDYVMPSMDFNVDAVDSWIDKYGSSRLQIHFVTVSMSESSTIGSSSAVVLPNTITAGLFVAVL